MPAAHDVTATVPRTTAAPAHWLTRQRVPTRDLRFHDLPRETRIWLTYTCLFVLAAVATGLAIRQWPAPIWGASEFLQSWWYTGVFKIGLLLIVPVLIWRHHGYRTPDLAYGWRATPRSLLVVVACFAIGVLINAGRLGELRTAYAAHPNSEALARAAIGVAIAFLNAGIPEEFVYRGMLQTRLEASWGRLPAILVSVALFVAWHLPTRFLLAHGVEGEAGNLGSVLLGTGVPVAIVGLVFAWAWDRHRNLPALIAIHGGIDTIPIVASMLQSVATQHR